jgi:flagellar basal body-associated protein FliL
MIKKMIIILVLLVIVYFAIQIFLVYKSSNALKKVRQEEKKLNALKKEYNSSVDFLNNLKKESK